jgi:2-methylcitrate dehydratase PrpD
MVKDGSGWGAFSGVTAGFLAADGYTGAPAVTMEAPEVADLWSDLGQRWRILEQYEKAYPVCRWAQPAVEAVAAWLEDEPLPVPREVAEACHPNRFMLRTLIRGSGSPRQ